LTLPAGAGLRSAVVEVTDVDKEKAFRRFGPRHDASSHTVTGVVEFEGLDRVFFNRPGGGRTTIRPVVRAAMP